MTPQIRPAVRRRARLRLALDGPSKAGKTTSALILAHLLGKKIGVFDTENGSSELYVGLQYDGTTMAFDVLVAKDTGPTDYCRAIEQFANGGYDVLVVDSLSPAWAGPGGMLELHDSVKGKNSWADWLKVNPLHARLIQSLQSYPGHVICTMRSVTEWVAEVGANGKTIPRKIGLKPQQRPMIEYEFDMLGSIDTDHVLTITGSRCPGFDGATAHKPGRAFWLPLLGWLETGAEAVPAFRVQTITDYTMGLITQVSSQLARDEQVIRAEVSRQYGVTRISDLSEEHGLQYLGQLRSQVGQRLDGSAPDHRPAATTETAEKVATTAENQTLQQALAQQSEDAEAAKLKLRRSHDDLLRLLYSARDSFYDLQPPKQAEGEGPEAARRRVWLATLAKRGFRALDTPTPEITRELLTIYETKVAELTAQRQVSGITCAAKEVPGGTPGAKSPDGSQPPY